MGLLTYMALVRSLVEQGHALRKKAGIKLRQPLQSVTYFSSKGKLEVELENILSEELNVKKVIFAESEEVVQSDPGVVFDTQITQELKIEGLARELERTVQDIRKKSGLKVGETVKLSYDTKSQELKEAFRLFDTKKTFVTEISENSGGEEVEIEGMKLSLKLS
jgi:isoleucyl-tRNA synthetase